MLEYPEYYECFIGAGELVDYLENEEAFKQEENNAQMIREENSVVSNSQRCRKRKYIDKCFE